MIFLFLNLFVLVTERLIKCIKDIDQRWSEVATDISGTTAIVLVHCANNLYSVNVGDSMSVLLCDNLNHVAALNQEQKVSLVEEQERLRKLAEELGMSKIA